LALWILCIHSCFDRPEEFSDYGFSGSPSPQSAFTPSPVTPGGFGPPQTPGTYAPETPQSAIPFTPGTPLSAGVYSQEPAYSPYVQTPSPAFNPLTPGSPMSPATPSGIYNPQTPGAALEQGTYIRCTHWRCSIDFAATGINLNCLSIKQETGNKNL
jgi:hypothetical protein